WGMPESRNRSPPPKGDRQCEEVLVRHPALDLLYQGMLLFRRRSVEVPSGTWRVHFDPIRERKGVAGGRAGEGQGVAPGAGPREGPLPPRSPDSFGRKPRTSVGADSWARDDVGAWQG